MDAGAHERQREARHGMVSVVACSIQGRQRKTWPRLAVLLLAVFALLAGMLGGLLRAGVVLPGVDDHHLQWHAHSFHGALMTGGFLGTIIGIERAVALGRLAAFAAPAASGLGAILMVAGSSAAGAWAMAAGALVFVGVSVAVLRRQPATHTALLLAASVAWLAGNVALASGRWVTSVNAWYFIFLVVTVAAERLEMTRLMRRRPSAQAALLAILAGLVLGAAGSALEGNAGRIGGVVYGVSLAFLTSWLARFDIARRTVRSHGLSRYIAVCLLLGYGWLLVAGAAWAGTAAGLPWRDAALHALGLGFIVSMVMAHAPVILPAITRIKLKFGNSFYVPLAVLHLSLAARLSFGHQLPAVKAMAASGNVAAILAFIAVVAAASPGMASQRGAASQAVLSVHQAPPPVRGHIAAKGNVFSFCQGALRRQAAAP
ncbi:NnrS family protein (plasmid) [Cupriavidus necator H16]|uniref:NnrS family protein n=1 Tax=Cupriavidus necator (strain ATCC 17699 / DSM 428 / KCTC 22496 / NCIMB 10442 / H16 / Stanier 337) TaxID=381666 RepID=Q7WXA1_CUPNH|nr:hypothetical protein [Cupriavidus necator]AAP85988.1 conserved hypothetical protein [Cupriavidus necator H16]QQB81295.1 hypothetical protein I6H87_33370 [Cupriavidus necator]